MKLRLPCGVPRPFIVQLKGVKAFLDTSVLVAAFYGDHQHHDPSVAPFSRQKKSTGCTAAHCLAWSRIFRAPDCVGAIPSRRIR